MGSRHVEQNINFKRQHSKQSLHWGSYFSLVLVQEVEVSGQGSENVWGEVSDFVTIFCPGKHRVRDKFTKGDYEGDLGWTILGTQIKSRGYFRLFWPAFFSFSPSLDSVSTAFEHPISASLLYTLTAPKYSELESFIFPLFDVSVGKTYKEEKQQLTFIKHLLGTRG